jgi:MFS family permease
VRLVDSTMETLALAQEAKTEAKTNWSQVYSLLGLNAAIVISWIAYHNFQPKVLELFHFTELSFFLVVAQALILVFIPPVAGIVGDYMIKTNGNRFVVLTVGISVTAMVFMLVAFTVGTATTINLTAALPVMIVIWLISMNVFHSPANSMLEMFAPARELPSAMALIVLTTEMLNALEPVVITFVNWIGPIATFALGGVLLLVTGYFFRSTTRETKLVRDYDAVKVKESKYLNVLMAGLLLGIVTAVIKDYTPLWFAALSSAPVMSQSLVVSFILVVSALGAWPLSKVVEKHGTARSLRYGLIATFLSLGVLYIIPGSYAFLFVCILVGVSYSFAAVAAFPYALQNLCHNHTTLGAGMFFGSIELADGVINILQTS